MFSQPPLQPSLQPSLQRPYTVPTVPTKTQGICIPPPPGDGWGARACVPVCLACAWTPVLHTEGCTQAWPLGAHSHWCRIRVHEYSMPPGARPPGECPNGATSQPETSCLTSDCGVRSRLERNKRALGHAGLAERRVSAALPMQCCSFGRDPCETEMFVYFATVDLPPRQG